MNETHEFWAVYSNTDMTEGRGTPILEHVCRLFATAERLGKHAGPQGSYSKPERIVLELVDGKWYRPAPFVLITEPTPGDIEKQTRSDSRATTYAKALKLGMTKQELAILGVLIEPSIS